jgi:hypothetical protein
MSVAKAYGQSVTGLWNFAQVDAVAKRVDAKKLNLIELHLAIRLS